MPSNSTNYSFPSFENDFWQQESCFQLENNKSNEKPYLIRWKSGEKVDSRLLTMLEFFRVLYVERGEFFKKIFPGNHDEFLDVFKKIGAFVLNIKDQKKVQTMQRSLSLGSLQTPEDSELSLDRFKVRTPVVTVAQPGGQVGATNQVAST